MKLSLSCVPSYSFAAGCFAHSSNGFHVIVTVPYEVRRKRACGNKPCVQFGGKADELQWVFHLMLDVICSSFARLSDNVMLRSDVESSVVVLMEDAEFWCARKSLDK